MNKNEEFIVDIIDSGFTGEGIAKIDGMTVFIPNAIKGEKVKIKILKVTTSHAFGKILEILKQSENRKNPDCETYAKCGGCSMRHIDYLKTLEVKKNSVISTLKKALGREIEINEVIGMDNPYNYRNKLQYPIGIDENGKPTMGVFAERTHRIISTQNCKIQDSLSQKIANSIFQFILDNNISVYNEKNLSGALRHIIIRIGKKTNEVMITLVTNEKNFEKEQELVNNIISNFPEVKTIVKNINNKNTNVILGKENVILYGNGFIYDYLGDFKFKISPMSFYQVNPVQTEKLYGKAIEFANLTGKETVFDLYCGIGTIGIFASKEIKKLYGIETVPEAIKDAKENAKINNVQNAEFFADDVEKFLPKFINQNNIKPDVIFIDPPRKGCDKIALETLLKIEASKIVYVSCNPATLGRDLKILEEKYNMEKIAICDMFPFTSHIECVCALSLKKQ